MKVTKMFTTEHGVDANYSTIASLEINYFEKVGRIYFYLYLDKISYESGRKPLRTLYVDITPQNFDEFEQKIKIKNGLKSLLVETGNIFENADSVED